MTQFPIIFYEGADYLRVDARQRELCRPATWKLLNFSMLRRARARRLIPSSSPRPLPLLDQMGEESYSAEVTVSSLFRFRAPLKE